MCTYTHFHSLTFFYSFLSLLTCRKHTFMLLVSVCIICDAYDSRIFIHFTCSLSQQFFHSTWKCFFKIWRFFLESVSVSVIFLCWKSTKNWTYLWLSLKTPLLFIRALIPFICSFAWYLSHLYLDWIKCCLFFLFRNNDDTINRGKNPCSQRVT